MSKATRKENGFALVGLVAVLVVLVAVGGAVYFVTSKNMDSSNSEVNDSAKSAIQAECKKEIDDKDFCKFVSNWDLSSEYKMTIKTTGDPESSGTMTLESDSNGNSSMVTVSDNGEEFKYISLNGATYMYESENSVWIKYPAGADGAQNITPDVDSEFNFDDSELPEAERASYISLGKESCGDKTCFKYQIKDPATPNTEQFVWFDDDKYEMYKFVSTDAGVTIEMTVDYVDVEIKEPSPVQEYSVPEGIPTEAELQEMINSLQ